VGRVSVARRPLFAPPPGRRVARREIPGIRGEVVARVGRATPTPESPTTKAPFPLTAPSAHAPPAAARPTTRRPARERGIDLEQRLALAAGQLRVRADRLDDGRGLLLGLGAEAGLLAQGVDRDLQRLRDPLEHLLRRVAQTALDLGQVRIRDPDQVRELAHRQCAQLALAADDLAQSLRSFAVRHATFMLMVVRA
jgi:hypothetical protein